MPCLCALSINLDIQTDFVAGLIVSVKILKHFNRKYAVERGGWNEFYYGWGSST